MTTRDQLEQFSAGPFLAAGEHLSSAAEAVNTAWGQAGQAAGTMASWTGATAEAANQALNNAIVACTGGVEPLSGAWEVVQSFVAAVLLQQDNFNNAMSSVRSLAWPSGEAQVQQDGSIIKPPAPSVPPKPTEPGSNPTPFEQAHLGLPPNPNWANYQVQVNTYNAQVELYQTWETASQHADKLERELKDALKGAEAADTRAQRDLADGVKAAADFKVVVAKGVGTPQYEGLLSSGNSLSADGAKWSQQEAVSAAKLAQQAANSPAKASELQQVYGNMAKDDNVFATSLLNTLGAKGLVTLANARANADQTDANNQPGDIESQADMRADQDLDEFLYNALANGTALTAATGDPGGLDHVSSAFYNALEQAGQATEDGEPGYYGLGQIFASARSGDVPMSSALATTVGSNMIGWVRDTGSYNIGPDGGVANGLDTNPLIGLANAASLSVSSAQALLTAPLKHADGSIVTGSGSGNNLSYLLSNGYTQGGLVVAYGNGAALGQLINAAADGNDPTANAITTQTVNELADLYKSSSYVEAMSGLDQPIANLLAHHASTVWTVYDTEGSGGPYSLQALGQVVGVVSQDDSAYQTLQFGLGKELQSRLNQDAANWNSPTMGEGEFLKDARTGAGLLAFVVDSRAIVAHNAAVAQAGQDSHTATTISNVAWIISANPNPAIAVPAGLVAGAAALQSEFDVASDAATVRGDGILLNIPDQVSYYAANSLFNHGLANQIGTITTDGFTQDGKLMPANGISPTGYQNLVNWLNGEGNSVLPGTQTTVYDQFKDGVNDGVSEAHLALGQP